MYELKTTDFWWNLNFYSKLMVQYILSRYCPSLATNFSHHLSSIRIAILKNSSFSSAMYESTHFLTSPKKGSPTFNTNVQLVERGVIPKADCVKIVAGKKWHLDPSSFNFYSTWYTKFHRDELSGKPGFFHLLNSIRMSKYLWTMTKFIRLVE